MRADREVGKAVAIEIAGRQGVAELVVGLGCVQHAGNVLVPELIAGRGKAGGRTQKEIDRTGTGDRTDILCGNADRQVVEAVIVEIGGGRMGGHG